MTAEAAPQSAPRVRIIEGASLGLLLLFAAIATWSLVLAQIGHHDGWVALVLGVATSSVLVLAGWRWAGPIRWEHDRTDLAIGLAGMVVTLFLFLPGAPYAFADKDPGVYVSHAFAIARTGNVKVEDPAQQRIPDLPMYSPGLPGFPGPGYRYPGFWTDDAHPGTVIPQFFHLLPATMATAIDLVGPSGAWSLVPLLAGLATLCLVLAVRRVLGLLPGLLTGALLATSMIQVWQAKMPSTEIPAQMLLAGGLLAAVIAIQGSWDAAGLLTGVALGTGYLMRPDGFLLIGLGAVGLGALLAARRRERALWWFAGGIALTAPYAFFNANVLRSYYSSVNGVPSMAIIVAAIVAVVGAGAAVGRWRPLSTWRPRRQVQLRLGRVAIAGLVAVLLFAWFRPGLLGIAHSTFEGVRIRSFDEQNLHWLARFVTVPGLVLVVIGFAVVARQRWDRQALTVLVLVVPGVALLPLYLWESRVSPRLMWWVRRYVPAILPALIVLIAIALARLLAAKRLPPRILGGLAAAGLLAVNLRQSLPLRSHREFGGSYSAGQAIADVAGHQQALFVFEYPDLGNYFDPLVGLPGPVWFIHDQLTVYLPKNGPGDPWLDRYVTAFADRPVFLVTDAKRFPAGVDRDRLELAREVRAALPVWKESTARRPSRSMTVDVDLDVWRVRR